ncbi:MAG: hypothetical protein LBC53_10475 [Spirochaetaceae bacterium]|nr:hypothetical protein [Spirochaetaceae bacterium]
MKENHPEAYREVKEYFEFTEEELGLMSRIGYMLWEGSLPGADGSCGGESECVGENGRVSSAEDRRPRKTV